MALAILTGSFAPAMPVFISTPSQPSSMAMAASDAVPTPASTITGTLIVSSIILILYGFLMPRPEPIGAASGMTAAQPIPSSFFAIIGSSLVYGKTINPSFTRTFAASSSASLSGKRVFSSPITSSFIISVPSASLASLAVLMASWAV